ncbi:MAG: F0F1 ATP synthase subunit epsilon [Candidatus Omnitrophota bacterium]|jgi:F-type H+-transporting ATPase subunit epsilon
MEKPFRVTILNPEKSIYEAEVVSLMVPAETGYVGILADHAPFAANLITGRITVREISGKSVVFNAQGKSFLEVLANKATLFLP